MCISYHFILWRQLNQHFSFAVSQHGFHAVLCFNICKVTKLQPPQVEPSTMKSIMLHKAHNLSVDGFLYPNVFWINPRRKTVSTILSPLMNGITEPWTGRRCLGCWDPTRRRNMIQRTLHLHGHGFMSWSFLRCHETLPLWREAMHSTIVIYHAVRIMLNVRHSTINHLNWLFGKKHRKHAQKPSLGPLV